MAQSNLGYMYSNAKVVKDLVDDKAKYTDCNRRNYIKRELELIVLLHEWGYPPIDRDEVYSEIFVQGEKFKRHRAV